MTTFWLEILIIEKNSEKVEEHAFLRLPQQLANKMLGIEENHSYKVYHTYPLYVLQIYVSTLYSTKLAFTDISAQGYIQGSFGDSNPL